MISARGHARRANGPAAGCVALRLARGPFLGVGAAGYLDEARMIPWICS